MSCLTLIDEDFKTPIKVLQHETREQLSLMLNPKKVIPSPEKNLRRDWRGLCILLDEAIIDRCDQAVDPMRKIFELCGEKTTIARFQQCLEQIDRYDVLEDTEQLIISDIKQFKERQSSSANLKPVLRNDHAITLDDLTAIKKNNLPRYDAFLLYDQADVELAVDLVKKLETKNQFQICLKDRFKADIEFENLAVINMISECCNYLIIIVSKYFSNNPETVYIMKYILSSTIKQSKIIACVYGDCIPKELKFRSLIFLDKPNPFCDPLTRLMNSLSCKKNLELLCSSQNQQIEEYIDTSSKVVYEETVSPKNKQALTISMYATEHDKEQIKENVKPIKENKNTNKKHKFVLKKKSKFKRFMQSITWQ